MGQNEDARDQVLAKILRAKSEISVAEDELGGAIDALPVSLRALKTPITKVLEDAIRKVKEAKENVNKLEEVLLQAVPIQADEE